VVALACFTAACQRSPTSAGDLDADDANAVTARAASGEEPPPRPAVELPPLPPGTRVGAYYFGSFSSVDYDPQITDGDCTVYGRRTPGIAGKWWAGVYDFYPNGALNWRREKAFTHLKPYAGYYDQHQNPCLLYRQIQEAKQYGLSYFSFYWFWNNEPGKRLEHPALCRSEPPSTCTVQERSREPEWLNDGLESFLDVRDQETRYPKAAGFDFYLTIAEMPADLENLQPAFNALHGYFARDYYLKIDGRPVLFILDLNGTHPTSTVLGGLSEAEARYNAELFIRELNADADRRGEPRPLVLLNAQLSYARHVAGAAGLSCLHPGGIAQAPWWDAPLHFLPFMTRIQAFLNDSSKLDPENTRARPLLPCATTGFDERPREGILWWLRPRCCGCPDMQHPRYFLESDDWEVRRAVYAASLQQVRYWMAMRPDALDEHDLRHYLTLYAWNEWHEGGILEPAVKYDRATNTEAPDYSNLETTRDTLGLQPRLPPGAPVCGN
jgi:hypothetical protein